MSKYGLMYQGKWVKARHVLGQYTYSYTDKISELEPMDMNQASAIANIFAQDRNIPKAEISVQEIPDTGGGAGT